MRVRATTIAVLGCLAVAACQSAQRNSELTSELRPIAGFYYPTLMLRRPAAGAADPQAYPGERGFQSEVVPAANWDCQAPAQFFPDVNTDELRACLASLSESKPFDLRYRMDFNDPLSFKIINEKEAPAPPCLVQTLPVLPAPREIIYQTSEGPGQRVDCYSTRIAYERDLFLGLWELQPLELKVTLPLTHVPADAVEVRALLTSWALAPFWRQGERRLHSRLMSDAVCEKCLGRERMIEATSTARPPIWP